MKKTKGIILAGGSGTRLYPATKTISKQLLPVYGKPMIFYPLNTLMLAGIQEILIISTPQHLPLMRDLLGDGSHLGIRLEYAEQAEPKGLPQAFEIGKDFIGEDNVVMILGDNLLYGNGLTKTIRQAIQNNRGATIFGTRVNDPERFGVVEFNATTKKIISLEEKPFNPKSNYAIVGLYIFDNEVCSKIATLKPSRRGELEMIDLHKIYLSQNLLDLSVLYRGTIWLDTGTNESMLEASLFVKAVQENKGQYIACLEETAHEVGFITTEQLTKTASELPSSEYRDYLYNYLREVTKVGVR